MKHLCRTDAVTNLDAERFFPAMIKLCRQSLTRRITEANGRQIVRARVFNVHHRIDHGWHGGEDRRAITFDYFEQFFRR